MNETTNIKNSMNETTNNKDFMDETTNTNQGFWPDPKARNINDCF